MRHTSIFQRLLPQRCERGSLSGMFVALATGVVLMVGLVVDGGRLMTQRRDATDIAAEVARAGAQTVPEAVYATRGVIEIDRTEAFIAASRVAARSNVRIVDFDIVSNGEVVRVSVERKVELPMLALLGVPDRTVVGRGSAEARPGIETEG